jgi:flavin-dependent dehydrogenase
LLRAAKTNGVEVFQPARITKVERYELGWRFDVAGNGVSKQITSKFLVDAAGRLGFLPRKRRTVSARTVALCGYISSEKCPRATLVEAVPDGWCWGAAIPGGRLSTMVFLDQDTVRAKPRNGLEFMWRSRLAKTELFSSFSGSQLIGKLIACDATTYFAEDPVEANWIRVGEACFALDPLSSTGVEKAMQSGLVAAIALHTTIAHPDRTELCSRFYRERQNETVSLHATWSSEFYGRVRRYAELPFWRKRTDGNKNTVVEESMSIGPIGAAPTLLSRIKISATTQLVEHPCILGNEICSRPALIHPGLHRPIAFLGGVEIGTLLDMVRWSTDLGRLLQLWSNRMSPGQAIRVASWLLNKQILETVR